jgi:hypothetical protein
MSATNGASPELVASLALRRAYGGAVAKSGDHYLDRGSLTPSHLAGAFDEFIAGGLLALGDLDPHQLRWVTVTDAGHVRYAQLRSTTQQASLRVSDSQFPEESAGSRLSYPVQLAGLGGQPDPRRVDGESSGERPRPLTGPVVVDSPDVAARALGEHFLANADRGDNAANDELVAELLRWIRAQQAPSDGDH